MTRILSKPVVHTYKVDDWEVTFVQMTDGDFTAMGDIEGQRENRYNPDGTFRGFSYTVNNRRSERLACYRTMVSCTLHWDEDTLIFLSKDDRVRNAMSEKDFNAQWDLLPIEIAQQLVDTWQEHNPVLSGESKATSKKSE